LIRIGLAAPNLPLRLGLRSLLTAEDFFLAGEFATLESACAAADQMDLLVLVPSSAAELEALPGTQSPPILLLTDDPQPAQTLATQPQAWGMLPLNASEAELHAALRALSEGLFVGAPALLKGFWRPTARPFAENLPETEPLSARELEVLQKMARGLANKQIAVALNLSEHTVKFHLSAIYAKLGVASRTEAVSVGTKLGLITQ
jgi:DNA-binding NarL/FixJ family response regulator